LLFIGIVTVAAFAMVNTPAEAVPQFGVVELGREPTT